MAPNLIGETFILAETGIEQETPKRTQLLASASPPLPASHATATAVITTPKLTKKSLNVDEPTTTEATTSTNSTKSTDNYKLEIVWVNVTAFCILHLAALYGLYLVLAERMFIDYAYGHIIAILAGFGITAGAHRLWAHKSYKAKLPLRIFLMLCQTMSFQNSIHEWVRDHRVHHKFCDTNADPHNSQRGFFFSHMGWLMCKKHPDVKTKGKTIDMSDLESDSVVMFQKKYYMFIMPVFCFILPPLVPYCLWGRSYFQSFFVTSVLRYVLSLHFTWLVNSAAHIWGMKPFDKGITPTENKLVAVLANGEGWHNYHHVFPWDYKAAELGTYGFNFSTALIDFFSVIGWAYDLKSVSKEMIEKRIARTGDGSHTEFNGKRDIQLVVELSQKHNHEDLDNNIWGWDDRDMTKDDKKDACIFNKKDQ